MDWFTDSASVDPLITFDPSLYNNSPFLQAGGMPAGGAGMGNTGDFSASPPAVNTGGQSWSAFIQGLAGTAATYALATKQQAATVKAQGQLGLAQEGQLALQAQAKQQSTMQTVLIVVAVGAAAFFVVKAMG